MVGPSAPDLLPVPTIVPIGDAGLVVRFGTTLSEAANRAAIALALELDRMPISGVLETVPNLVSVLLRYDPKSSDPGAIAGELRLRLFGLSGQLPETRHWAVPVRFDGPDLDEVASTLGMRVPAFIRAHNRVPLRVLATGFAPGFVYCGLHPQALAVPRRTSVRAMVPAGSVLFAAGQTAIAATDMPTGWHVIGHTGFANFDSRADPPTQLTAGDLVAFEAMS